MALNEDTPATEAQRLVTDDHPEDNQIEQDSIERKIKFHNLHITVALGSIAFFLYDVALDWYFAYEFYSSDQHWYATLAITFFVLPALFASCLSGWWYFGGEQRRQCFPSATRAVWIFRVACHACFLSPLARLVDSLRCGLKCKSALKEKSVEKFRKYDALLVYEDRDATFLRLLQTYLGLAPQLVLRLSAVFAVQELVWQHVVISAGSVLSLAWALVAYKVTSDLMPLDSARRTDSPIRKLIYGLAHFFGACARFIALAIGAAFLPRILSIGLLVHLIVMFVYVRSYHRKAMPVNPFSWDKDSMRDHAAYAFLAVVHTFTFLNLNEYRAKARYLFYFTLCFLENVTLMICWWYLGVEDHETVHYVLFWTPLGAFLLGVLLLFWYSHRCRLTRPKSVRHETHVNGLHSEEAPLKFDNKEEVCQEVVVIEEPIEKEEAVESAAIQTTGIQIEELVNDVDGAQSSLINEEPIKEKVTEIWFNRAPKPDERTKKSGQLEETAPCVIEDFVKNETDIAVSVNTALSRVTQTRPDSEKRADHGVADSRESAPVVQVERATRDRQLEDVEKLLNELNAYEADVEVPRVPDEQSQAQQVVQSGRTERGESLPVGEAQSEQKSVSQEPRREKIKDESQLVANAVVSTDGSTGQENADCEAFQEHRGIDEKTIDLNSEDKSEMCERSTDVAEDKAAEPLPSIESCIARLEDLPSAVINDFGEKEPIEIEETTEKSEEFEEIVEEVFEQKAVSCVDQSKEKIQSAVVETNQISQDENDQVEPLDVSVDESLNARENDDEKVNEDVAEKETEPEIEASTQIENVEEPRPLSEESAAKETQDHAANDDESNSAEAPRQENADNKREETAASAEAETIEETEQVSQQPHDDEKAKESLEEEIAGTEDSGQSLQPISPQIDSNQSHSDVKDCEPNEAVVVSLECAEEKPVSAELNLLAADALDQTNQVEICEEPVVLAVQESLFEDKEEINELAREDLEIETGNQDARQFTQESPAVDTLQLELKAEDEIETEEDCAIVLVANDIALKEAREVVEDEGNVTEVDVTQELVPQTSSTDCQKTEVEAGPQETEISAEISAQPADANSSSIEEELDSSVSPTDGVVTPEQLDLAIETSVPATNDNQGLSAVVAQDPAVEWQELEKQLTDAPADELPQTEEQPNIITETSASLFNDTPDGTYEGKSDPAVESQEAREQLTSSESPANVLSLGKEEEPKLIEPFALPPNDNRDCTAEEESDPDEGLETFETAETVESAEFEENSTETQSSDVDDDQAIAEQSPEKEEKPTITNVPETVAVQEKSAENSVEAEKTEYVEEENTSTGDSVAQSDVKEKLTKIHDENPPPRTKPDVESLGRTNELASPIIEQAQEDKVIKAESSADTTIVTDESQQIVDHEDSLLPTPSTVTDLSIKVNEETKDPEPIQITDNFVAPTLEASAQQISSLDEEFHVTQSSEDNEKSSSASDETHLLLELKPHEEMKVEQSTVIPKEVETEVTKESLPILDTQEVSSDNHLNKNNVSQENEATTVEYEDQQAENYNENEQCDAEHMTISQSPEPTENSSSTATTQVEEPEENPVKHTAEKPKRATNNEEKKSKFQSRIPRKKQ